MPFSKLVQKQLSEVRVAKLGEWDADTHSFTIPRFVKSEMAVGNYYRITLDRSLLNPSSNGQFTANWNGGSVPSNGRMVVCVKSKVGSLVNVDGAYCDESGTAVGGTWSGWLPTDLVNIDERM